MSSVRSDMGWGGAVVKEEEKEEDEAKEEEEESGCVDDATVRYSSSSLLHNTCVPPHLPSLLSYLISPLFRHFDFTRRSENIHLSTAGTQTLPLLRPLYLLVQILFL